MIIIDRLDANCARCEDGEQTFTLPRTLLAHDAAEGDVLALRAPGVYVVDAAATAARKRELTSRFARLRGDARA